MKNTPLTRQQRINLPNTLLLDPATGQAAAYNGIHRLITAHASAALVAYAKAKGYKETAWDESQYDPEGRWYEMPEWANKEVRAGSTLLWVRSGQETEAQLRAIPPQ
ncbi:MAG: hypothetical protein KAY02_00395 [Acidovorax sp.]|nr:hypothetical protein [Acidovorax sp.]